MFAVEFDFDVESTGGGGTDGLEVFALGAPGAGVKRNVAATGGGGGFGVDAFIECVLLAAFADAETHHVEIGDLFQKSGDDLRGVIGKFGFIEALGAGGIIHNGDTHAMRAGIFDDRFQVGDVLCLRGGVADCRVGGEM